MSYSIEIARRIMAVLDSDDWKYEMNHEKEYIKMGLNIDNKMKHVDILFDLRDDKYLLFVICPLNTGEAERKEMCELLNRINYTLMFGCFEMDTRDGEVRFRNSVDCDNCYPSREVIIHNLYRSIATIRDYGDAIIQVQMGFGTAQEAFERARNNKP